MPAVSLPKEGLFDAARRVLVIYSDVFFPVVSTKAMEAIGVRDKMGVIVVSSECEWIYFIVGFLRLYVSSGLSRL